MSATPAVRQKQEIGLPVADFTLPLISGEGERRLADFLPGAAFASEGDDASKTILVFSASSW
jgi:hypothetical protein